jgi:hypothetical protein
MNYFFDHYGINETKTTEDDQNYSVVYGANNEIIYHI